MAHRSRRAAPAATAAVSDGRWTLDQAAEYAAKRDFAFCALLATNRRAFAVARQLGWGSRDARRPQSNDRGGVAAASQQQRRGADAARAPKHAQRRSAARSARHHAERAAAGPAAAPAVATPAPPLRMADTDVLMGDERPSSPSRAAREEYALLADASDALAARQPRVQRGSYSYADSATGHAAPGRSI